LPFAAGTVMLILLYNRVVDEGVTLLHPVTELFG
jgi:hypothetical protein